MKNFVQDGHVVTVTAPTGGVLSGGGVLVGALFGVAAYTAAEGDDVKVVTVGVFDLPKAAGVIAAGAAVYWDDAAKKATGTAAVNPLIGVATKAAASDGAIVRVRLNATFGAAAVAALAALDARVETLEGA